jgi:hypothetical protein
VTSRVGDDLYQRPRSAYGTKRNRKEETHPILQHEDFVSAASGRETMCGKDDGLAPLAGSRARQLIYRVEDRILRVPVEGGRRLVEHQEVDLGPTRAHERARDGDALPLAAGQPVPRLLVLERAGEHEPRAGAGAVQLRSEAVREAADERVRARARERGVERLLGAHVLHAPDADVLRDARVVPHEALEDGRGALVQDRRVYAPDVGPVDEQRAGIKVVQSQKQIRQRRFACQET